MIKTILRHRTHFASDINEAQQSPAPIPAQGMRKGCENMSVPLSGITSVADYPPVKSFVDSGNNGLDGVIPRAVLENAKGFAIFTIFKAGFLFSARAGSGIVIARLPDGSRCHMCLHV